MSSRYLIKPWAEILEHARRESTQENFTLLNEKTVFKLSELKKLAAYNGVKTYELAGNVVIDKLKLDFHLNHNGIGIDLKDNRPCTFHRLDGVNPIWHLHPTDTMPYLDENQNNISNCFSVEDVDFVISNPMTPSIILNTKMVHSSLKYPCIYVFAFVPHDIKFYNAPGTNLTSPTDSLKVYLTSYQRVVVDFILHKMYTKDDRIDWEDIKRTFRLSGIRFEYLFEYSNSNLHTIVTNILK
jgi:hypothetical protein